LTNKIKHSLSSFHWLTASYFSPIAPSRIALEGLVLGKVWFLFPGLQQVEWDITWHKAIAFFLGVELSALNHLLLDG
jgi:hypothetical protein